MCKYNEMYSSILITVQIRRNHISINNIFFVFISIIPNYLFFEHARALFYLREHIQIFYHHVMYIPAQYIFSNLLSLCLILNTKISIYNAQPIRFITSRFLLIPKLIPSLPCLSVLFILQ